MLSGETENVYFTYQNVYYHFNSLLMLVIKVLDFSVEVQKQN